MDTWNYQVGDLSERHRCVCVDLRGHGESDKPVSAYTYDEMCGDLAALLQRLDLHRVTIVGWSMGAGVALSYLLDHNADGRVSRAALLGPATPRFIRTDAEPFGMDEATAAGALEGVRRAYPETMRRSPTPTSTAPTSRPPSSGSCAAGLRLPAYAAHCYFATLLAVDLRYRLHEVDVPVLICAGRHDQVCDPRWAEYLASHLPDSKLVWFDNSGHSLMVEEPDKLSAELDSFVT